MPAEFMPLPDAFVPWVRPLGLALLHALWQGVAIGAAAWLALRTMRDTTPQARYATACAALAACVLWPLLTLWRLAPAATHLPATTAHVASRTDAMTSRIEPLASTGTFDAALPWLVALWACGAALMLLRTAIGLRWVAGLRRDADRIADGAWVERMRALTRRFGLRDVPLAVFDGDGGPVSAGVWRPVVFVPASLLSGMPPALLEALLAHELAHIRRHDYLANLLQCAAEALLFFHPVVWWLSRRIRQERELVADDLAASVLGEPKRLALALAELDRTLSVPAPSLPPLAQAAHGGHLVSRIRSLLQPRRPAPLGAGALPLGILAVACIGCFAYAQSARTQTPPVAAKIAVAAMKAVTPADTDAAATVESPRRTPRIETDDTIALIEDGRDGLRMSGNTDDVKDIRAAQRQVDGDFLWMRRDGKAMVVRDAATVARVRDIWTHRSEAEIRMETLQAEMELHAGRIEAIGQRIEAAMPEDGETPAMRKASEKIATLAERHADLAAQQAVIAARDARVAAKGESDTTHVERERRMAELERKMAALGDEMRAAERDFEAQSKAFERGLEPVKTLEMEMQDASRPMEALSRQMEALAVEYERQTLATDRKVRAEFDRAVAAGLAEPVRP